MQKGTEDPANAGGSHRDNGSRDLRNEEAGARLHKSHRKRRRRPGHLRTPGRTVGRGMKTLPGRFRTRSVMQRASLSHARPLAASHLALRFASLRQQRHHRRGSKQQDQRERDGVSSAVHLSAVYTRLTNHAIPDNMHTIDRKAL